MKELDPKFVDVVTRMGHDVSNRHGRSRVMDIADDPAKAAEFCTQMGAPEITQAAAAVLLREHLGLPEVKGDKEMAKAKKEAAPKAKRTGNKKVGICAEVLRMVELREGATTGEIHASVVKKFPDRDPVKLYNTVRGELQNLPKRTGRKMVKVKDKKEDRKGTIYHLNK